MTFDDDFLWVELAAGRHRHIACKAAGVSWPPPERVNLYGFWYQRERYSQITDEQREKMTHVARGARYVPAK